MKKKILTILVMFAMFISPVMADDILTTTNPDNIVSTTITPSNYIKVIPCLFIQSSKILSKATFIILFNLF